MKYIFNKNEVPNRSGRLVYSAMLAACGMGGRRFDEPCLAEISTNTCRHICKYVDPKGSAFMLTSKQSAGVAPGMNRMIIQARKHERDLPWL